MKIALIAVLDEQNGIGKNNKLLCHLPADLKRFKQLTTGHVVVMGRKTFESLPNGPLPNRTNVVLTKNHDYAANGCISMHSTEEIMKKFDNEETLFVIGGGEIYRTFVPFANILYITRIYYNFESDTFFPEIDSSIWSEESKETFDADEKNKFRYSFIRYSKITA